MSNINKIGTLVKNVNIVTNLAKLFNIHIGHIHYTDTNIPFDEKLFKKDEETIKYILYHHPASVLWKKIHPYNVKKISN